MDVAGDLDRLHARSQDAQIKRARELRAARRALESQARSRPANRTDRVPPEVRDRIAHERAAGATLAQIAAGLTRDSVPTARGGGWPISTVRRVLMRSG